jgi:hypothetical protein
LDEITTLWRFSQFHVEPVEYRVVERTAKTFKAQQVKQPHHTVPPKYIHTVRLSQLGVDEWFLSPRDAYAYEARKYEQRIVRKQTLQNERSRLSSDHQA